MEERQGIRRWQFMKHESHASSFPSYSLTVLVIYNQSCVSSVRVCLCITCVHAHKHDIMLYVCIKI